MAILKMRKLSEIKLYCSVFFRFSIHNILTILWLNHINDNSTGWVSDINNLPKCLVGKQLPPRRLRYPGISYQEEYMLQNLQGWYQRHSLKLVSQQCNSLLLVFIYCFKLWKLYWKWECAQEALTLIPSPATTSYACTPTTEIKHSQLWCLSNMNSLTHISSVGPIYAIKHQVT